MTEHREASVRDKLRSKIFNSAQGVKKEVITFFGGEIELRQPTLGDIIAAQTQTNREAAVIETLVKYAFVPGTNEHVFEDGDAEPMKDMPFGADFIRVTKALERLTEVNFLDSEKPAS